ncbi:hypothetical protein FQR65_LT13828 [Abscondita terminalis]|nr:hypothetical protein FQR65_LT13828 [Abscondita terminalis]
MIPRAVSDLFMELAERNMSYFVRFTYFELCNEEMDDLLFDHSPDLQATSDLNEELENYASSSLESLRVVNDISEIADSIRNSVGICLSKHLEDSERCTANSSEAYIDQKRVLKKIFPNIHNNILE